jgi:hypothetical protein
MDTFLEYCPRPKPDTRARCFHISTMICGCRHVRSYPRALTRSMGQSEHDQFMRQEDPSALRNDRKWFVGTLVRENGRSSACKSTSFGVVRVFVSRTCVHTNKTSLVDLTTWQ